MDPFRVRRHFHLTLKTSSSFHFNQRMSNGEAARRSWLIYSTINDAVYRFCCKVHSAQYLVMSCSYCIHFVWGKAATLYSAYTYEKFIEPGLSRPEFRKTSGIRRMLQALQRLQCPSDWLKCYVWLYLKEITHRSSS